MSRCDSAATVPSTSELLPEPDTPVKTVSRRLGRSTLTSRRLLTRAPWTRIRSCRSAAGSPGWSVSRGRHAGQGKAHEHQHPRDLRSSRRRVEGAGRRLALPAVGGGRVPDARGRRPLAGRWAPSCTTRSAAGRCCSTTRPRWSSRCPTSCCEVRAKAWPGGEAGVTLRLEPLDGGARTRVTIEEDAKQRSGPSGAQAAARPAAGLAQRRDVAPPGVRRRGSALSSSIDAGRGVLRRPRAACSWLAHSQSSGIAHT